MEFSYWDPSLRLPQGAWVTAWVGTSAPKLIRLRLVFHRRPDKMADIIAATERSQGCSEVRQANPAIEANVVSHWWLFVDAWPTGADGAELPRRDGSDTFAMATAMRRWLAVVDGAIRHAMFELADRPVGGDEARAAVAARAHWNAVADIAAVDEATY